MSQIGALFGGLWGDAGANFADEQGGADKVFGTKPKVADYTPVNLSDETGKAVDANLTNYDSITALLDKVVPGFSTMLAQGTTNTLSELRGELPQDVQDQVYRSAAFKSLMGGFGGTAMGHALGARDLGRTSLDLTQIGTNAAQQWSSIAEEAYSPFTISTGQQTAQTAANNAGKQAQEQMQFNVDAAPDPGAAGVFNVDAALGQQMLSFGMGSLGGIGGGGSAGGSAAVGGQGYAMPGYSYSPTSGYTSTSAPAGSDWRQNATWSSDRRLKTDITYLRMSPQGHRVYSFRYKNDNSYDVYQGVMADECQKITPAAVGRDDEGFLFVNYGMIDVPFILLRDLVEAE